MKEEVWNKMKDNSSISPKGRNLTLKIIGEVWKDFKFRLKRKYFEPKMNSGEPIVCDDKRVDESQWNMLVDYWCLNDVQNEIEQNKKNRAIVTHSRTNERTPHSIVEEQMSSQGL